MNSDTLELQVPFPGFYGSILDHEIDAVEERDIEALHNGDSTIEHNGEELDLSVLELHEIAEVFFDNTDYGAAHRAIAKAWVEAFADYVNDEYGLGISLEFIEMTSPREYNFTTDRVFAKISPDDVRKLFEAVDKLALDKLALDKVCEQHLKSRDGFISFYDHQWQNWGDVEEWDYNQLGMLFYALLWDEQRDYELSIYHRLDEKISEEVIGAQDWGRITQRLYEIVLEKTGEIEPDAREFPIGVSDTDEYVKSYDAMNHLKQG